VYEYYSEAPNFSHNKGNLCLFPKLCTDEDLSTAAWYFLYFFPFLISKKVLKAFDYVTYAPAQQTGCFHMYFFSHVLVYIMNFKIVRLYKWTNMTRPAKTGRVGTRIEIPLIH